ncbi:MAG: CotH kinase family protein [Fibrobacter sp.]|nr:CotH kinase family protein [Fibrobacter sp.]
MFHICKQAFPAITLFSLILAIAACSNSQSVEDTTIESQLTEPESSSATNIQESSSSKKENRDSTNLSAASSSSSATYEKITSLDDTKYPYAEIPRIVIETENHQDIKDRDNEIPAKFQIWGKDSPESDILELTIRGRGNSSWTQMPKHSFKLEFQKKQALLGMPKDKDWALIANYADKTLLKNYLVYNLAERLGMEYTPRCKFVELYLNDSYEGVYLITETIKASQNRLSIPSATDAYIVEFDQKYRKNEQVIFSNVLTDGKPFRIHHPKNISEESEKKLSKHIQDFETFLTSASSATLDEIESWINTNEFIKHFWVQEFSKNPDASFYTSVYFTWTDGKPIQMGPVWDFDLAFGGHYNENAANHEGWRTKNSYWNEQIFNNSTLENKTLKYWKNNREIFEATLTEIDSLRAILSPAAKNNFKRWDILKVEGKWISKAVSDYDEAMDNLKNWIEKRLVWIDNANISVNQ